jgi:hypothetical protein
LREEQVGTLDDVLEVRFALGINQTSNIRDVDGFGASATRYKKVCLKPQMGPVPEICAVEDDFAGCDPHQSNSYKRQNAETVLTHTAT